MTSNEKLAIAVQALQDVAYPITKMRRELEEGCQLNGLMAVTLSRDPEYLRTIATDALKKIEGP